MIVKTTNKKWAQTADLGGTQSAPGATNHYGGLAMSFYHTSKPVNRQNPKINTRTVRHHGTKLKRVLYYNKQHLPSGSIVRPIYSDQDQLVGYITIPISEWASLLIL